MPDKRFKAIDTVLQRPTSNGNGRPSNRIPEYYATNVFNDEAMRQYLSEEVYESVKQSVQTGEKVDRQVADQVASSMKAWATNKGATHFTHWFQPLTGMTAEKHDAFFSPTEEGGAIENFNGEELIQQEPDASSFPSGGLRTTFEARGYTAWDPSSPAFIMEIGEGRTLCIPTIFVAYTGEALDYKSPLMKSFYLLEQSAAKVCRLFERGVDRVSATLGWEQEYFVVDEALYYSRPDLVMSNRTLFGQPPAKNQQLDDHYFGSIPERVYRFMLDLETEALKLGIPIRTRHNEVAPSQFECAPYFEDANLSVDHNQLLMDLMERVASRHNLKVLLHEKPYAGINGSGKHNNWSMKTNKGKNLLAPGTTPKTNLQFLTFFINTIKAVHDYNDLLRASIASSGNDHRMGGNEAPPAIFSVYIGELLMEVLEEIEEEVSTGHLTKEKRKELKMDIHSKIPDLFVHNTDRNRTSPFAFTGNKFELRAAGSSINCSSPIIVLNTIVGHQLKEFHQEVQDLIGEGQKKDEAVLNRLSEYVKESKGVIFNGDNYSDEWVKEAESRGLNNIQDTPRALDHYVTNETKKLFEKNEIFTERELEARHRIRLDNYTKRLHIESQMVEELAMNHVLPAVLDYQNKLINNVKGLQDIDAKSSYGKAQTEIIEEIGEHVQAIKKKVEKMEKARDTAEQKDSERKKSIAYCDKVKPYFQEIRSHVDALELIVEDSLWPLPKYREMLFIR